MTATRVINELKSLPAEDQDQVYLWLRQRRGGVNRLAELADKLVPPGELTEEEILELPRARPSGF